MPEIDSTDVQILLRAADIALERSNKHGMTDVGVPYDPSPATALERTYDVDTLPEDIPGVLAAMSAVMYDMTEKHKQKSLSVLFDLDQDNVEQTIEQIKHLDERVQHVERSTPADAVDLLSGSPEKITNVLYNMGDGGTVYVARDSIDQKRVEIARSMHPENEVVIVPSKDPYTYERVYGFEKLQDVPVANSKLDLDEETAGEIFGGRVGRIKHEIYDRVPYMSNGMAEYMAIIGCIITVVSLALQFLLVVVGMSTLPAIILWALGLVVWGAGIVNC